METVKEIQKLRQNDVNENLKRGENYQQLYK